MILKNCWFFPRNPYCARSVHKREPYAWPQRSEGVHQVGSLVWTNRLKSRLLWLAPQKNCVDFWLQNSIRLNFYFAVSEWITSDMIYTMRSFQKLRFLKSSELHGFRHKLRGWKSLPPTFLVTGRPNLAVVGKHQIWSSLRCYKWLEGYLYDVLMDATWCNS